jgi:hypothetical protein
MSDKTYEMLWDCQFCGTTKNLGKTHRFCPVCGAPQNPDSRYYPSDEEKVAVEDHQFVGVDVTCPACNQLNSADNEFCQQCGSPLTEGAKAKRLDEQSRAADETFESSGSRDVVKEQFDAQMVDIGVQTAPEGEGKKGFNPKVLAMIGVVIALIAGGLFVLNMTESATVYAADHSWERTVDVEVYRQFTEMSWDDVRPAGDNVTMDRGSCVSRQRSTNRVADGETCRTVRRDNGDGTYSESQECTTNYREEPVYDDWCRWRGYRWENDYARVTSGEGLSPEPYYEEVSLNCEGQSRLGCQRANYSGKYYVDFVGNESRTYTCDFAQDEWADISIESVWTIEVRMIDADAGLCHTLERQN